MERIYLTVTRLAKDGADGSLTNFAYHLGKNVLPVKTKEKLRRLQLKTRLFGLQYLTKSPEKRERWFRDMWLNRPSGAHLDEYWESDDERRRALVKMICDLIIDSKKSTFSILEYGSLVSPTFRILSEKPPQSRLNLFAVEPNNAAVEYLRNKLPQVSVFEGDDVHFTDSAETFPSTQLDLSFSVGVFATMSTIRVRRVLKKLAHCSDRILLHEHWANLDGKDNYWSASAGSPLFYHPYQSILSDLDFEIEFIQTDIKYGKFTCGYILAKRIST